MTNENNHLHRRDLLKAASYFATGLAVSQLASCTPKNKLLIQIQERIQQTGTVNNPTKNQ
ncbi:MAG: hypothetical protein HC939_07565 [Pleurocapsa sp. SU_5_0]|nr:hypothetical protein [Pleurocapsa sp. SU_5_0]